jgi:hypothetical protein
MNAHIRNNVGFLHDGLIATDGSPSVAVQNYLMNSGFDLFQRQAPGTLTSVADDVYGPDRWNVLTQTAAIQVQRSTGSRAINDVLLKQNQVAAQRMGIEQIIEAAHSQALRSKSVAFQFACKPSTTTTIRYAILEWTGTADTVTSDVVLSWTSSTYTPNNFFLAASLNVIAVGSQSVASGGWTTITPLVGTFGASLNNVIVFIWTEGTAAQNVTIEISEAVLSRASATTWYPRSLQQEIADCERYYEKSYDIDTLPGTNTTNGAIYISCPATAASVEMLSSHHYRVNKRSAGYTHTYYDIAGASGKIATLAAAVVTNNVTPSAGVAKYIGGFRNDHDDGGNINGVAMHFTADGEL